MTTFESLHDRFVEAAEDVAPTPAIAALVAALIREYPDDEDGVAGEASPWAAMPLIDEASGPLLYVAVVSHRAHEVREVVAAAARTHGLVCFDPQTREIFA